MSYLVFNKDDNNCKIVGDSFSRGPSCREAKYMIKDIKLKYVGECNFRGYCNRFVNQYFKIVAPIILSDKFRYIFIDRHDEGVVKIDDEYFIKISDVTFKLAHIN
jgi:hypothetical protein